MKIDSTIVKGPVCAKCDKEPGFVLLHGLVLCGTCTIKYNKATKGAAKKLLLELF